MLVMPIRRPLYNLDPSIEPTCTASVSPLGPFTLFQDRPTASEIRRD